MNNRLFFKHTFVLAGMIVAVSTTALALEKQKDENRVQAISNWSKVQSVAPKLFGAGLILGGACGAYLYSGALKKYVTEKPLDALKNATFLGGSLLTNVWLWRSVNDLNHQRVTMPPEKRSALNQYLKAPDFAACVWNISASIYNVYHTYSYSEVCVLGICSAVLLANRMRSTDCISDNARYDALDKEITSLKEFNNAVNLYNSSKNDETKTIVQGCFDTYKQSYSEFYQSIKRGAENRDWVTQACERYELINKEFKRWDRRIPSDLFPEFDQSVFTANVCVVNN